MMTVYHPDPPVNAGIIADALDAERADLAAGYPPRRWRCPCGTEHSRGHFGAVGVHRCLACGYAGTGGVLLDDGPVPQVTEANEATTYCRVADQIVHCDQVKPGDLMLVAGVLASVEDVQDDADRYGWVRIIARHASLPSEEVVVRRQGRLLAAVRRYVEG